MTEGKAEREAAGQVWDAGLYDSAHNYVWHYGEALLELLAPQPGERILDIGAGTGHLTAQIAAAGASVTGLDASESMVQQARALYPDIEFVQADAADFAFGQPFDAVFSNATLHWVGRPDEVAECISRALKPGGRFVTEFGGRHNVDAVIQGVQQARQRAGFAQRPPIWYYPSVGEYASVLERHGMLVTLGLLFERPTPQDGGEAGLRSWLTMFCDSMLDDLPPAALASVIDGAEASLRSQLFRDGTWYIDYRRLRIVAHKL